LQIDADPVRNGAMKKGPRSPASVSVAAALLCVHAGFVGSARAEDEPARVDPDAGPPPPTHDTVLGPEIAGVTLERTPEKGASADAPRLVSWRDLSTLTLDPALYTLRFHTPAGSDAVEIPVCAGRSRVTATGAADRSSGPIAADAGPIVLRFAEAGEHEVSIEVKVGGYERRIACGAAPRVGLAPPAASTSIVRTTDGLGFFPFASPHAAKGGGKAVLFVPPHHDRSAPAPLLVGLHPWNGDIWTYPAYAELLREAAARDVVLLMPSGLGNSLYTADAEDEVLRAIDATAQVLAVDPRRVSIWGASMGGAGATTVAFHHPDRFAGVTSFFGDAKYDLATYVRAILPNEAAAHAVNALDVVDNARHLSTWLVHGEDDHVSPITQSAILAQALEAKRFDVRFDRVPHEGHSGAIVASRAAEMVDRAATARVPAHAARVTYRSVRPGDLEAYGVHLVRSHPQGDAFVDVEGVGPGGDRAPGIYVHHASGVRSVVLEAGVFGAEPLSTDTPIHLEDAAGVDVRVGPAGGGRIATP
jgi:enterochelin esterase-like enzyme